MKRILTWLGANVGFVCIAIVLVYCVIHAFDPPRLNWGDSGSDYNVMTAGRNFQKYGFLRLHLTPYLLDPSLMSDADRSMIYTHYPQLPDLMNGLERTVLHLSTIVQFRFVALMFSFGALFFGYRLVERYWGRQTAQIAVALCVVNPLWIQHADYLHHTPYAFFFGLGSVYLVARYVNDGERWPHLIGAGVCLFLTYLASYDFWIFAPLLLALVTFAHHRAVRWPAIRTLGTLAAFAVAALAFKLGTNMWALGGVQPFMRDLHFQFAERATDAIAHIDFHAGIWPTLVGRVERCFSLLLFPVALFWAVLPVMRRRWASRWPALERAQPNPWLLLFPALPFLMLFVEIWVGQYYPTLLVLPFYAVGSAALATLLFNSSQRVVRLAGGALVVALLANSIDADARFKKAYLTQSSIATLRAQLDSVSTPGQFILVNHMFDGPYHYYFDRNVVLLMLNPAERMDAALSYYTDPKRARVAPPSGAIFVQDKHVENELFDKGFYYILAKQGAWDAWGNPDRYHQAIDALVAERDSALVATVARRGTKLYETDAYVVWRIMPVLHAAGEH